MVQDNDELEEPKETELSSEEIYQAMALSAPSREVEVEEDDSPSLSDAENRYRNESDIKYTIRRLFPNRENEVYNLAMIARISPDMFQSIHRLLVNAAIKRIPYKIILNRNGKRRMIREAINVPEIASEIYFILTVGLEGKGRIDLIELAGSAREAEELDNLSKQMGLNG